MQQRMKSILIAGASALAGAGLAFSIPAFADRMSEQEITMGVLPDAVADTVKAELGGRQPDEVEKLTYENIVVLYEVEYYENDEEYEIYVYPHGELARKHSHEGEDEDH